MTLLAWFDWSHALDAWWGWALLLICGLLALIGWSRQNPP